MLRTLKSEQGYNLVEIAMVIGLISILTAIAIPTFQDMRNKGREAEAKVNLTNLYSTMKVFRGQWLTYVSDFNNLGYELDGDLTFRVGFAAAGPAIPANYAGAGVGAGGASTAFNTDAANGYCGAGLRCQEATSLICAPGSGGPACNVTNDTFLACACGQFLSEPAGQTRRKWMINEQKIFSVFIF